jgi:hypothetical protein
MSLPLASLSLDLDNRWTYLKTHGEAGWESFPSYYDIVVPRALEMFAKHDVAITFFIVGKDAANAAHHAHLRAIADAGHEIGNHSYLHEPWLHLYTRDEIVAEFARTEEAIESATGQRPVGFRGPGFSFSPDTLSVQAERGYLYDASTFPTFLGPLARWYFNSNARFNREQQEQRKQLFGSWSEGLRRLHPHWLETPHGKLLEIPVTTMPISRAPIHMSYIAYLQQYSHRLASAYLRLSLLLCRMTGVEPSYLLHPSDFLGCDDNIGIDFFPGMRVPARDKLAMTSEVISRLKKSWRVVTMQEHAAAHGARAATASPRENAVPQAVA